MSSVDTFQLKISRQLIVSKILKLMANQIQMDEMNNYQDFE